MSSRGDAAAVVNGAASESGREEGRVDAGRVAIVGAEEDRAGESRGDAAAVVNGAASEGGPGHSRVDPGGVAVGGAEESRAEVERVAGGAAAEDRTALSRTEPSPAASSRAELGRLRWRCRRGLRELDELLTRYVDEQYATAPALHRAAFRELLDSHDPLIHDYFLGRRRPPDPILSSLIGHITAGAGND